METVAVWHPEGNITEWVTESVNGGNSDLKGCYMILYFADRIFLCISLCCAPPEGENRKSRGNIYIIPQGNSGSGKT